MHGRLKVRTSDEEKERKKKEQELKVKAYRAAMGKIQLKRQRKEFDDEMLLLTSQILLRNPDVSTVWNIRRECLQSKAAKLLEEGEEEQQRQSMYDAELGLTEQCLKVNPKSYGAWHQRCWTLEHSPCANWDREVLLCTKYLKLDERNFHTWDYRRYVVAKAGVAKQQELDFCTEKIKANFSNYSSWHYRSKLLPVLYPYEGDALPKRPMSEVKLKEELEMVLTAAFTDPNDSSAWFYQRWLLGYSRPELAVAAFRCNSKTVILAVTKPISCKGLKVTLRDTKGVSTLALVEWLAVNGSEQDTTWSAQLPDKHMLNFESAATSYEIDIDIPTMDKQTMPLKAFGNSQYYFSPPNRSVAYSAAVLAELQSQLESCNSLLEYEPDSKWTLLTTALLMRAIDRQAYHSQSLAYLDKLQKVDCLREGYYKDLASKWIMEKLLTDWSNSEEIPKQINLQELPQLSTISYVQYLSVADKVLLSNDLEQSYGKEKGVSKLHTFEGTQ